MFFDNKKSNSGSFSQNNGQVPDLPGFPLPQPAILCTRKGISPCSLPLNLSISKGTLKIVIILEILKLLANIVISALTPSSPLKRKALTPRFRLMCQKARGLVSMGCLGQTFG